MRKIAIAALAATSMLALAPSAANASMGERTLAFRGLTLHLPDSWTIYKVHGGLHVVTGRCAKPKGGFFTPDCRGFWVLGPGAIKYGSEGFGPYKPDRGYYPASDVEPCPVNGKYWRTGAAGKTVKGYRQVGDGHKAVYRAWPNKCGDQSGKDTNVRFTQREWYLPKSKILIVDDWNTQGLPFILENGEWTA
ncbi:hypothetical protein ACIBG8_50110 [Nonomuraea sp. NPDC050556]|uniref:hypothetical protein n=1 Tax=Nonomuraea sp. NPDC050556 TaxID=3364369 RepID=UPI0037B9C6F1